MARLDALAVQAQWIFDKEAWKRLARRLFIRALGVVVAGIFVGATAFYYRVEIFHFLIAPANGRLSPYAGLPVFFNPLTALGATFDIAGRGFLLGAYPVAAYSIYTLAAPILPSRYRRAYKIFVPLSAALFLSGAAFAYYIVFPRMLMFLLGFSDEIAVPMIALDYYLSFLFKMVYAMGLVFQIPPIMFLLTKMNIVSYQRFRHSRRLLMIFAAVLSGFLTPTFDFVNWAWMAVPTYMLFEIGLFAAWVARPEKGNYLFLGTIGRAVARVVRRVRAIVGLPGRGVRWVYRKIRRQP